MAVALLVEPFATVSLCLRGKLGARVELGRDHFACIMDTWQVTKVEKDAGG